MTMPQLINGLYPVEYFQLANVDPIQFSGEGFWASAERYASVSPLTDAWLLPEHGGVPTSEYKELDLGRVRQINGLILDIMRMPIDIVIEYDAVSADDGTHQWVQVKELDHLRFDSSIFYDASAKSSWFNAQFYFTNPKGQPVHARYLRITYKRRADAWPTRGSSPFPWSIMVKNLRTFRYVMDVDDAIGSLFEVEVDPLVEQLSMPTLGSNETREVVQQLVYPETAMRGNITPDLLGFSFLAQVNSSKDSPQDGYFAQEHASWRWQMWKVTDPLNSTLLDQGVVSGAINSGRTWVDCYFKAPIEGSLSDVYELRVKSLNASASNVLYVRTPSSVPGTRLPGSLAFVSGSPTITYTPPPGTPVLTSILQVGDYIQDTGGGSAYKVTAVTSTSITIATNWPGASVTKYAIKIRPLKRPASRIVRPLPGGGVVANGATTIAWTADAGTNLVNISPVFNPFGTYTVGQTVYPTTPNGYAYVVSAISTGTAGGSEPAWPTAVGSTVVSGGVTFKNVGSNAILLDAGDYIRPIGDGPTVRVASVTNTVITLQSAWPMPTTASGTRWERVQQTDGDLDPTHDALISDPTTGLVMRMWADVGDSGRDVLGNAYRYGARRDKGNNVLDAASPGWLSAPRPSADAVEALYFDVRSVLDTGQKDLTVVDVLKVAPRTPGIRMHVYFTQDNLNARAPETEAEWDHMMWTPVNEIYTLRKENVIELPQSIKATYIKLEFTNLRPLPFTLPNFPELPPVEYRRYPTWVEDAFENAKLRRTVEDWFIQNAEPVQRRLLQEMATPIREFEYETREFLAALAQGRLNDPNAINNGLVDAGSRAFIDPVTSSNIYLGSNRQFQGNLLASLRTDSLLGRAVAARTTSQNPLARERVSPTVRRAPYVSTRGDRVSHSFSTIAETPMWFNRKCRHQYRIDRATFNKKAYYAGIKTVEFQRNDYRVEHDDTVVDDILHDDMHLVLRSMVQEVTTSIPDATELLTAGGTGVNAYVSYRIGNVQVVDEPIILSGYEFADLLQTGGPATNLVVWSSARKQGQQYTAGTDYVTAYATDEQGNTVNQIARSALSEKLIVDHDATGGNSFQDTNTVVGVAKAAVAPFNLDAGTVDGRAIISGVDLLEHNDNATLFPAQTIIGQGIPIAASGTAETRIYGGTLGTAGDGSVVSGVAQVGAAFTAPGVAGAGESDAMLERVAASTVSGQGMVFPSAGTNAPGRTGIGPTADDALVHDDLAVITGQAFLPTFYTDASVVQGVGQIPISSPAPGAFGASGNTYGGGAYGWPAGALTEAVEHIEAGRGVPLTTGGMDFWVAGAPVGAFDTLWAQTFTEGQDFWVGGQPVAPFGSTRESPTGVGTANSNYTAPGVAGTGESKIP